MPKGSLFLVAVLHHPKPTKDQAERGETPKSETVIEPKWIIASSEAQAGMLAARMIPESHTDKIDDLQVMVRPF